MNAEGYIVVNTNQGPVVLRVEGVLPTYTVLQRAVDGKRVFYAQGKFYYEMPPASPLTGYKEWIDVPVFLKAQALSNAMLAWAQSNFDELAYKRSRAVE